MPKQPTPLEDNAIIKAGECPTEWEEQPAKRRQKNTEARWTVKHGIKHDSDKNHVNLDKRHTLIQQFTDSTVHDKQVLEDLLLPAEAGREVWGDSASRSEAIETQLRARHLRAKIQYKGGAQQAPHRSTK